MKASLRARSDFLRVYQNGKRYDGILMTAFVLPNRLSHHRIGVTASRKTAGLAVQRNRAKRLLKETFRLNRLVLSGLGKKYDWVLNAKRNLLSVKLTESLPDFRGIIESVAGDETQSASAYV